MKRFKLISDIETFIKPQWMNIFLINAVISFVIQLITAVLSQSRLDSMTSTLIAGVLYFDQFDFEVFKTFLYGSVLVLSIANVIGNLIRAALSMALLDAYRENTVVNISGVFKVIKEDGLKIIAITILTSFMSVVLLLIPYVRWSLPLVMIIVNLYLSFAFFFIREKNVESSLDAIKLSVQKTRGHKFALLKIQVFYLLLIYAGVGVGIIGLCLIALGKGFGLTLVMGIGLLSVLSAFGLQLFLSIKYRPYLIAAPVVYYAQLKTDNNAL